MIPQYTGQQPDVIRYSQDVAAVIESLQAEIKTLRRQSSGGPTHSPVPVVGITAGAGMTGGGLLSANRTLNVIGASSGGIKVNADDLQLDIDSLAASGVASGDFFGFQDVSGGLDKKISFANFEAALNHDDLAGFVAAEHIDWTSTNADFDTTGALVAATVVTTGDSGFGTAGPLGRVDIEKETRTGTDPTHAPPLYATNSCGSGSDGVEFGHSNQTQGFGFGFNTIYGSGSSNQNLNIKPSGGKGVGIGMDIPTAKLHVEQESTTGAKPVLKLDQRDVSEPMVELACTIGTGNGLEAVAAKTLTVTHFEKVVITGGLIRYRPIGTIA